MSSIIGHEDTGIRSVVANLILSRQGSLILRQTKQGYEIAGVDQNGAVFCQTWPETERVLLRLGVPSYKVDEIADLLCEGTDVIVHRKVGA